MPEEKKTLFDHILESAWNDWLSNSPKPHGTLYHYTTADALLNILRTRSLWATNLLFTNDPTELTYAELVISDALEEMAIAECEANGDAKRSEWLRGFKSTTSGQMKRNNWYSVSFCADGDLLSQWRSYGAGGGGFAIGWSPGSPLPERPTRVGIEYDPKRQREMVVRAIRLHLAHIARHRDIEAVEAFADLTFATGSLGFFLSMFLYSFKHQALEQEQEFRFVYVAFDQAAPKGKTLQFRNVEGAVKPYIEADFAKAELVEIAYGPTANATLTERWLRMALDEHSFGHVKIRKSEVPMR